jgi:hypothetical protein
MKAPKKHQLLGLMHLIEARGENRLRVQVPAFAITKRSSGVPAGIGMKKHQFLLVLET